MRFSYRDHSYVRFVEGDDVLLELRMIDGALVVWGSARRDRFDARLVDDAVEVLGDLGDAVTVTDDAIAFHTTCAIEAGDLPPDTPLSAETARGASRRK